MKNHGKYLKNRSRKLISSTVQGACEPGKYKEETSCAKCDKNFNSIEE